MQPPNNDLARFECLSLESRSSQAEPNTSKSTAEKVKVVCAFCTKVAADPLRCDRCKVVLYCGKVCRQQAWPAHKGGCKEIVIIRNNQELIPIVEKCFQSFQLSNTEVRFKYENEELAKPPYKFRIIHNPHHFKMSLGKFTFDSARIMAYDGQDFPAGVADLIKDSLKIEQKLAGRFMGRNYFELGSNVTVL